jgi:hypothetical protein
METWTRYTNKDYATLDKSYKVKLTNGKVLSVDMKVGSTLYDTSHNEIETNDILCFTKKKDFTRFRALQKHNDTLAEYDIDKLNDFEWALLDTFGEGTEEYVKIEKLFKKLASYVEQAQTKTINESNTFLN